jgi:hypothetical protein
MPITRGTAAPTFGLLAEARGYWCCRPALVHGARTRGIVAAPRVTSVKTATHGRAGCRHRYRRCPVRHADRQLTGRLTRGGRLWAPKDGPITRENGIPPEVRLKTYGDDPSHCPWSRAGKRAVSTPHRPVRPADRHRLATIHARFATPIASCGRTSRPVATRSRPASLAAHRQVAT